MRYDYQLAVIGGGAGGLTAAAGAASFGASTALIEREIKLGGDCLHFGCVPSKALITAASEAVDWSVHMNLSEDQYNSLFTKAMSRVKEAVEEVHSHDSKQRFIDMGVAVYEGSAKFLNNHTLQVGNDLITAKRIVIASGSSPSIPSIQGIEQVDYLTNETIFSLKERPYSIIVIGGGAVGVELAQALAHLGVKTTLLESSETILAKEDEEIADLVQKELAKKIIIITGTQVDHVESADEGVTVYFNKKGSPATVQASHLLVAAGRKANIDNLELENAEIATENGVVKVDSHLRTSQKNIYAIGDCNGSMPFTHAAGMEGKIAVSNAVLGLTRKASYENVPWVVYTTPELYHLGLTEQEAREKYGDQLLTFKTKLETSDRFMAERNKTGLIKVLTTGRGKIVGAHAFGPAAGEWMQEVGTLKALNKKFQAISSIVHPYPARNNAIVQTADLYWREKLFNSKWNEAIKWYVQTFR
ncbi:NAD(P)/FAD-dependent oxidoreductase [Halobacillus sp. A5]|uniref:dihydrolipoyl dehydrogenase family protein n=1 Tax=Halobacillus sp. A5 TaxID=2880263 RepID=UPI0020A644E5|nr:NAD(P)/FAD-dependent oxidoreductase [Halobacillus sp. A5]MCP3026814.1 NAD(P)/FAD-dependent oxidoreductase [Halobacillus sp. A5]